MWVGRKIEANFWTYEDFNTCIQLIQSMAKGQIISKANYGILNSSKKRTRKFDFTTMILVFVHFLEEIEGIKKTFRN
jgi:hypothetical protein